MLLTGDDHLFPFLNTVEDDHPVIGAETRLDGPNVGRSFIEDEDLFSSALTEHGHFGNY